jgi:hypothetical protein
MASFSKNFSSLCMPAMIFFVLSMIALVAMIFQNLGNTNTYTVGNYSAYVPNCTIIFFIKFIYILFWTYVLNLICKDGHVGLSWLLLLLPWLLMFVIMGLLLINK